MNKPKPNKMFVILMTSLWIATALCIIVAAEMTYLYFKGIKLHEPYVRILHQQE